MKLRTAISPLLALLVCSFSHTILPIKITVYKPNELNLLEINLDDQKEVDLNANLKYRWTVLRSLAAGLTTGAFTGLVAQATEHYCWPVAWYLSSILRGSIINSIADVARHNDQNANAPLLYTSSWVSSWIAYILALQNSPKNN